MSSNNSNESFYIWDQDQLPLQEVGGHPVPFPSLKIWLVSPLSIEPSVYLLTPSASTGRNWLCAVHMGAGAGVVIFRSEKVHGLVPTLKAVAEAVSAPLMSSQSLCHFAVLIGELHLDYRNLLMCKESPKCLGNLHSPVTFWDWHTEIPIQSPQSLILH